ncbi:MAG TPA: 16S rRNA (adenine(1518)-N(6)/adenine(1519)-N(6))-dimethyltransferase RsmA [Gemmatimonadaceae bacterium]|nr:16S rRNA (adenine(1518)-N(6)/adenine(1519)-N(6))-dimethyltransferase RsmA [Gemmatimonadaceae bacterium]
MSAHGRPRKRFGQHFLTDPRLLGRIADALGATPNDTVIEIGPGRGALTAQLLERAGRVIAIEIDRDLVAVLRERFAAAIAGGRLVIVEGDVLEQDLGALVLEHSSPGLPMDAPGDARYLLTGNVPYNITTPIMFHAMRRPRPERAVYLVQREVAERVIAGPDDEAYGALSVNVQALARASLLFGIAAKAFTPPPKVESAVLRIEPRADPVVGAGEEEAFRVLVQGAFGLRRKQMRRVVRTLWSLDAAGADAALEAAGIDPAARPETLGAGEFARLLRARP